MREKFTKILRLTVSVITLTVLIGILMPAQASAATITVPTNYGTIQGAINAAAAGDTVYVKSGTYYEHLTINKLIVLQGEDKSTTIIDGSGSGNVILLQNANHVEISNITVKNGQNGIHFQGSSFCFFKNIIACNNSGIGIDLGSFTYSHDNTLQNIEAYSNIHGIGAYSGSNNLQVLDSNLHNNSDCGVIVGWLSSWTVENTVSYSNGGAGIGIDTSSGGTIRNCIIYNNNEGVGSGGIGPGEHENTIVGNTIYSNVRGIRFDSSDINNVVKENKIYDNEMGIYLYQRAQYPSYNNVFYHNDLCNALNCVVEGDTVFANTWDNNYPDGGNYYSDYTGSDTYIGASQTELSSDGLGDGKGDTVYEISTDNTDRYPLMKPWHSDFPYQLPDTNQPPIANAGGSYLANEGSPVTFDASSSSDPDGDALQYRWDFESDGTWDTDWLNVPTATYTWADNWSGSATLNVSDGELTSTDTATVTISNANPVVEAGQDQPTVSEGDSVSFSGSYTDAGSADIQTFLWDFGDDSPVSETLTPTHVYADNGIYTVTFTVTDKDGGVGTDTLTVTIDNANPVVVAGDDQTNVKEGDTVSFSGSYSDVGTVDTHTIEWDFGDGTTISDALNPTHIYADNGVYTVTLTVTDKDGGVGTDTLTVTVNNVDPAVGEIKSPIDPVLVNTQIATSCTFTDAGTLDTHTGVWDWGDYKSSDGVVSEINGAWMVTGEHVYTEAGVYWVTLTVTDDDGGSYSVTTENYVVAYNPEGGFVTGGGWINSPAGAYVADDTLEGKATFGFVSKYEKGATVPTGKTEFQFKVADLNFKSTSYDWLVVAGSKAKYKGTGTINGEGNYGFMLSAVDGEDGIDRFRIKIWDKDLESDETIYDNEINAAEDAYPSTAISGGSIVVHKENNL